MNGGSLFSGFLFGRRGFLRREKNLSTVDGGHDRDPGCPPPPATPTPPSSGTGVIAPGPDGETGAQETNDSHHHHQQQQQQQHHNQAGLLIQVPKNVRYVVLRHRTTDSPDDEDDLPPTPGIGTTTPHGGIDPLPPRPHLRKTPAHGDRASSPTRNFTEDVVVNTAPGSGNRGLMSARSSPCHSPEKEPPIRRVLPQQTPSLLVPDRPSRLSSIDGSDSGSSFGLGLFSRSLPLCAEPCRIVVETDDSPIDPSGNRFGDSRRNSSSSVGEGTAGPGPPGSRRGSISPKDQRGNSSGGGGGVSSFLLGLGGSTSGAPSPAGVEDQFWVPENILQKKRANSMVSPAFLGTNGAEFGDSGRRLCASLDYSSTERLKNLGTSPSTTAAVTPSAGPGSGSGTGSGAGAGATSPWSVEGQLTVATQRLRRASMHSALDHTKIDASMYERPPPLSIQKPHGIVQEDNIGSIHFRLTFDPDRSVLTVLLYQGVDLLPKEGLQSAKHLGVFARVRLIPDHPGPPLTSQIHCRSLSPKFDEDFAFEVSRKDLGRKSLEIAIVFRPEDSKSPPHDEEHCAGHVLLPLDQLDLSEPVYLWKGLSHFETKTQPVASLVDPPGELLLSLSYLSSAERLTVIVTKAKGLNHNETPSKTVANPYVRVTLFHGGRKLKRKKTTTKRSGPNPEWNEAVVFNLTKDLFDSVQAEVAVFSENLLGTDEPVGRVIFGSTVSGVEQFHWMSAQSGRAAPSAWFRMTLME